ncbi:MAG TPA: Ku protein [Pseudonocardiaceae bacterium]|jgi:DNA end-binding protein Ku|nr:Ku protein [Pseudonocardiaceae bacterium]
MARAIWTGAINFGLVTVPVGLYSATEDHSVHFHQLERGTSDRIRYRRVNERTGREVEYADIVKARDIGGGEYVVVEQQELADVAPGRSRSIDITTFVDLDEIDPIFFQKTYWLAPTEEQYGRAYGLLRQALARTNRAGIATFVMRGKEYLTAVRADEKLLALETLYFADEIRDPGTQFASLPDSGPSRGKELDMAAMLIESMAGPWRPEEYRDTYTERVEQLIADKQAGRETVVAEEPPGATEVNDLLDALQRSVESARAGRKPSRESTGKDTGADLSTLRRTELQAMARALDVPGRSTMSRAELEEAVAQARGSSGSPRAS